MRYMTRSPIKKITCLIMTFCFLFFSTPFAYAWDPITHWHINKEANPEVNEDYFDLYCDNGMGPDMFMIKEKSSFKIREV